MFYTKFMLQSLLTSKTLVIVIVALIIIIPISAFLISQRFKAENTTASPNPTLKPRTSARPSSASNLGDLKQNSPTSSSGTNSGSAEISFGPTLNFKIALQGRPKSRQATKIFLGIAQGKPTGTPQYLLSFNIDVPDSGEYKGLSLAGLTQGSTYTAFVKAPAQIATSSAFVLAPSETDLGLLNLITGDLNEDNIINSADYSIAKSAYSATPNAKNWNSNVDFNLDGIINVLDLSIILKNIGKTGTSGTWYSTVATQSAILNTTPTTIGGPASSSGSFDKPLLVPGDGGYWLWVPKN